MEGGHLQEVVNIRELTVTTRVKYYSSTAWPANEDQKLKTLHLRTAACSYAGADPGFFLGGGAPLTNDITDR